MENTIDNKAKFFALYWGQPLVNTGFGKPMRQLGKSIIMNYENSDKFNLALFSNSRAIELKNVEDVTDEDVAKAAEYCKPIVSDNYPVDIALIDYFRNTGVFVPYLTLTLDLATQYGWVIIKQKS